jgi:hypothetical protein
LPGWLQIKLVNSIEFLMLDRRTRYRVTQCRSFHHAGSSLVSEQPVIDNRRYNLLHQRVKNQRQKDSWMRGKFRCRQHQTGARIVHAKPEDNRCLVSLVCL